MIRVAELVVYPVKSLRGVSLDSSAVEARGLRHDRRWMVVDPDGEFMTQRKLRKMALVDTWLEDDGLRIGAEGLPKVSVPYEPRGEKSRVRVWNDDCEAVSAGKEADAWLSEFLGSPCSLVYMPDSTVRPLFSRENPIEGIVGFADTNPILVASRESMQDLNSRMDDPLPIRRFRPNVVVEGCGPFDEDRWPAIRCGDLRLRRTMRAGRCLVTTIDPATAESGDEPLRTLATYRKEGNHVWFGSFYAPAFDGRLSVGDAIEIETAP